MNCQELGAAMRHLNRRFPFLHCEVLGFSHGGRPIYGADLGIGDRRVLVAACFHGNEYLTADLAVRFLWEYGNAFSRDDLLHGVPARELFGETSLFLVPMVNPDGADLCQGAIPESSYEFARLKKIAAGWPALPFPDGWKANGRGVDLNLNYDAQWEEIAEEKGVFAPAPQGYAGEAPASEEETRTLISYTEAVSPLAVCALHSQGEEIYYRYRDFYVPGAEKLGRRMAMAAGYTLTDPPENASRGGYKDWFIKSYGLPGYTVEVGLGENPLPRSQLPAVYEDVLPLLVTFLRGK